MKPWYLSQIGLSIIPVLIGIILVICSPVEIGNFNVMGIVLGVQLLHSVWEIYTWIATKSVYLNLMKSSRDKKNQKNFEMTSIGIVWV